MKKENNLSANLSKTNTFQACKISKNIFTEQDSNLPDYFQQEKPQPPSLPQLRLSQDKLLLKEEQLSSQRLDLNNKEPEMVEESRNVISRLAFEQENQTKSNEEQPEQSEESEEDLADLWDQIQDQPSQKERESFKEQFSQGLIESEGQSFELSQKQMEKWLEECDVTQPHISQSIQHARQSENSENKESSSEADSWSSLNQLLNNAWNDAGDQITENESSFNEISIKKIRPQYSANVGFEVNESFGQFIIQDTLQPCVFKSNENLSVSDASKSEDSDKYGPWELKPEHYPIFENPQFTTIMDPRYINGQNLCRRINWEISEEVSAKKQMPKSRQFLKTQLIQYGRDFILHDLAIFAKTSLKQDYHLYLGIQSIGFSTNIENKMDQQKENMENCLLSRQPTDCLFFPYNGECYLETEYPELIDNPKAEIKLINVYLSLTKQKIAVIERKTFAKSRDRRQVLEVRSYDEFQKKPQQYLAIIESKIGKFNSQWFCETIVYVPKKKTLCKKICEKDWSKLKMSLIMSEAGSIVAELGIIEAQSSVTNCILYGDQRKSQVMVGTFQENAKFMNYILRISGISPVVGMATAISRKLFVNNG